MHYFTKTDFKIHTFIHTYEVQSVLIRVFNMLLVYLMLEYSLLTHNKNPLSDSFNPCIYVCACNYTTPEAWFSWKRFESGPFADLD